METTFGLAYGLSINYTRKPDTCQFLNDRTSETYERFLVSSYPKLFNKKMNFLYMFNKSLNHC